MSSIEIATAATRNDDTGAEITPACAAVWKTTKPNSPPWASRMMKTGRSSCGIGIVRAIAQSTPALSSRKPTTVAAISSGCAITTAKSMLMPTAMKKRPSSSPLNGSMSVSSSRRYSLSASSTPARKAPSAIDRPTAFISAAVATTSSSDAAVKISGVSLLAIQRSAGRSSNRPPRMITTIVPIALARRSQLLPPLSAPATARNGTSARIGIAAMSCSSETLRIASPDVVPITLRSARTPRPIAVDDIARPSAATTARRQSMPQASAPSASSSAEPNSCTLPQPKIGFRSDQSRCGSSSRPTRKSIRTTPNSANCSMSSGRVTSFSPHGPIRMPAPR